MEISQQKNSGKQNSELLIDVRDAEGGKEAVTYSSYQLCNEQQNLRHDVSSIDFAFGYSFGRCESIEKVDDSLLSRGWILEITICSAK
jgi:hypothetical protein